MMHINTTTVPQLSDKVETRLSKYMTVLDQIQTHLDALLKTPTSQVMITNIATSPTAYYCAIITTLTIQIFEQTATKKSKFIFNVDDGTIEINNARTSRDAIDTFVPKFNKIIEDLKSGCATAICSKD